MATGSDASPSARAARLVGRFDEAAEATIARLRGRHGADVVFYTASALGEFSLVWIALALARARRGGAQHAFAARRAIAGALVETITVNGAVKALVRRSRPIAPIAHPLPFRQPLTSSFPSGHASGAFFAATLLAEDDPLGPLYYALAAIVATSRLYVRIHHASDVVAGVVLGLVLGRLVRAVAPLPEGPVDEQALAASSTAAGTLPHARRTGAPRASTIRLRRLGGVGGPTEQAGEAVRA